MKDILHRYYEAWAAQDMNTAQALLHSDLVFVSPQDCFESAESFLTKCWKYSTGLTSVRFISEVYEGNRAFVILRWQMEDGKTFTGAEYLEISNDRIRRIVVVNNDPGFEKSIESSGLVSN